MTALVLTAAAGAFSNAVGIGGVAATALSAGAAVAGRVIDSALLSRPTTAEGPRLDSVEVTASAEGTPIPRTYGRTRVGGQVIWATNYEEVRTKETQGGSGKGGPKTTTITYAYYANFAVALAEGPIAHIGRVWADGEEIDLDQINWRFHSGSDTQSPDPLIEAKEGANIAPGYRGTAYVVFERLPLEDFGNRLPQLAFEIYRPIGSLETSLKAIDIIPGAGEFAYDTQSVRRTNAPGEYQAENNTSTRPGSDWTASINEVQALCPNLQNAALVVTWFGSDLRAGECLIEPKVDQSVKSTIPISWSVAGVSRDAANVVSTVNGRPAFGGTPNDESVVRSIIDLKSRGLATLFYPFIMMDIPSGNGLANPYGGATQAVYPWRGRITCHPAIGQPGSPDKTAAAATQITSLVGTATPAHFSLAGSTVVYSGPPEWTIRRMILHYAMLSVAAGGVDRFVIGSELVGLTSVRDGAASYPFVDALKAIAADVRTIVGPSVEISYAADWSEYHSHRPTDGSGDVFFNLDSLWSDANIDFIGIDNYLPMADWRDGASHLDAAGSIYSSRDPSYLLSNIEGGEFFDWFYASQADRRAQIRSPITDGAYGKDWVFRQKDIRSWWLNAHVDRPGGSETSTSAWTPQSKPIIFTEFGCPAVDKGANQPNVFLDPKSSESFAPHFSTASRDDAMQRRALNAVLTYWDPASGNNPVSSVYGGNMIPAGQIYAWAWDARSFPAFPADTNLWADAFNWDRGHWLNGRLGTAPIDELIETIAFDHSGPPIATQKTASTIDGYTIERVMSARDALSPLENAFALDLMESGGELVVRERLSNALATLAIDDLAQLDGEDGNGADLTLSRAQDSELPVIARVSFAEPFDDYRSITVEARIPDARSVKVSTSNLPMVMAPEAAQMLAEGWLHSARSRRETARFSLPPSRLALEPGDALTISDDGRNRDFRIEEISDQAERSITGVAADRAAFRSAPSDRRQAVTRSTATSGPAEFLFLDLPLLLEDAVETTLYMAAHANPWDRGIAVYRSPTSSGFSLQTVIETPAIVGETLSALDAGAVGIWDRANSLDVSISAGTLSGLEDILVFAGNNALAVETDIGWEILQFADAVLIADRTYRLSRLLRGQLGTDRVLGPTVDAGARIAILNADVEALELEGDKINIPANWRIGLAGREFSDPSFFTLSHTPLGEGRRPYSPVQLRAVRDAVSGDIAVSWIRRTRTGGDSWETPDVPLGETEERYAIEIRDGGVVHSSETTTTAFVYTQAKQIADLGAALDPGDPLEIEVFQISTSFGRGAGRREVLNV